MGTSPPSGTDKAAYLTGRDIRDWLIEHVEILDDPVTLPTGEQVTGIAIGSNGTLLLDCEAVAE
jgi:hypothetical protein